MTFLSALADLIVPVRCAGCGVRGFDCCPVCLAAFGPPVRVPVRGVGPPVFATAPYDGVARELLLEFKERGRRSLASCFGLLLALALPSLGPPPWRLVPAPSRSSAARQRGGDHMVRVAHRVEGASVAPVLTLASGVRDSVGLSFDERRANLRGKVRVLGRPPPSDVVLIDDVVTSGATARACVEALAEAGVGVRAVLVLTSATSRDVSTGAFRRPPTRVKFPPQS